MKIFVLSGVEEVFTSLESAWKRKDELFRLTNATFQIVEREIDLERDSKPGNSGNSRVDVDSISFTVNGVSFNMILVEHGTFTMGATPEINEPLDREKPVHELTITKDYYMGETQVTQALWVAVMGSNPSQFKGDNNPVECVSWDDCQEFIKKLNELTGKTFRLPTEAEWEFAARGGNKSKHTQYAGTRNLEEVAWYDSNSGWQTHPVAQKKPNELGIYDMSGNVWEWCNDWYDENYYSKSPSTDPQGPTSGSGRVLRGGCWGSSPGCCPLSYRSGSLPGGRCGSYGLRFALQ